MKIEIFEREGRIEIYDFVYKGKPRVIKTYLDILHLDRKGLKNYFAYTDATKFIDIWFLCVKPQLEKEFPELFL